VSRLQSCLLLVVAVGPVENAEIVLRITSIKLKLEGFQIIELIYFNVTNLSSDTSEDLVFKDTIGLDILNSLWDT